MTQAGTMDSRGLTSPTGKVCCSGRDCLPAEVQLNEATDELEILAAGKWWPALAPRWFVGPTPDGSWFACAYHGELRCTLGGVGT